MTAAIEFLLDFISPFGGFGENSSFARRYSFKRVNR
jgi:hypothetical protein